MIVRPSRLAALAILMTLAPGGAAAQDSGPQLSPEFARYLRSGLYVEQFVAEALRPFRAADVGNDGLDAADVALARRRLDAFGRAQNASLFVGADLDGDGVLSQEERELARLGPAGARAPGAKDERFDRLDRDGDGRITLQDAVSAPGPSSVFRGVGEGSVEPFMAFDSDGDGRVMASEAEQALRRIFSIVDRNGDGLIATEEFQAAQAPLRIAAIEKNAPSCEVPRVADGQQIVAFGLSGGDAVPTATVVGQNEDSTTAELVIEEGDQPLYIVLTSGDAMIWRVAGAKDRVARLVLASAKAGPSGLSAAGVVGLPADKVMVAPRGCFGSFSKPGSPEADAARSALRRALGRAPDAFGGAYKATALTLPAMTVAKASRKPDDAPAGFDPRTWRDALRFAPGGVVEIDPATVVAGAPVVAYEVLPQQVGLAKLVGEGAIERVGGTFRIVKPIPRFPAGLAGAHSVGFSLAPGVPRPKGDLGHSCIAVEDGSEPASGRFGCRGRP
ncbi:EF-hand domain-containing protein [Methylopila henanensis]|uniref:EF-hand domain-containing protein n=1 Tax=Methylopila henanensis TaxID=873516 RepID=A0ABW4KAW7_9HYPH